MAVSRNFILFDFVTLLYQGVFQNASVCFTRIVAVMLSYHTNPSGVLFTDMTDRPDSLSFGEGRGEAVIGS